MKHRRADAHQRRRGKNRAIRRRDGKEEQTQQSHGHSDGQGKGLGAPVGVQSDERL
jgi:hypothetical protein